MKKNLLWGSVVALVSILLMSVFALLAAPSASATENPYFKKYDVTQTWYAPSPASVESPFAVPQTLTVLECGGIRQDDKYTIDSPELEKKYQALIAGGVLNSPADDAPFHPRGVVTALPDCVVVPDKPAPIVESFDTRGIPDCDTHLVEITTTTNTTDWVYNKEGNIWKAGETVPTTSVRQEATTEEECPVVVVPPVVTPEEPETPVTPEEPVITPEQPAETPVTPVTPVVEEQVVDTTPVTLTAVKPVETTQALAYTGSDEWVFPVKIGSVLALLGAALVIIARIRRGKADAGVIE